MGTSIGGGLVVDGRPLHGALHPEIGHLRLTRRHGDNTPSACPFHPNCAEGLASEPAIARRLGINRTLSNEPTILDLVAGYLGELAAALVLAGRPSASSGVGRHDNTRSARAFDRAADLIAPVVRGGYSASRGGPREVVRWAPARATARFRHRSALGRMHARGVARARRRNEPRLSKA